jgi:hypothetical protein
VADGPQATLTRFASELTDRDRPDIDPDDLPIVVLWGARGSESSALLAHLHTIRDWPAPRAHLDGEQLLDDLRPHLVANRLAFQLGRKVQRFGRARFPRFFLGMQAVRHPLDPDSDAREARRTLLRRSLRNRPGGRQWLRESAQAIAGLSGLDTGAADALGLAVDGAMEAGRTLALLRGAGLQWYVEGLGRHFADAADALVELSVAEFLDDHDFVDRVLCQAFLADLRGEFASGAGLFFVRRRSAMVLLDNVGTPPTTRFVNMLAALPDGTGPLLVVAASHRRFPDAAAKRPDLWQPDDLSEASRERWAQQRVARGGNRHYPVWVDPIDDVPPTAEPRSVEVEGIARQHGLRPAQYPAVAFARRLTCAHPAGMDMVVRTLARVGGIPAGGAGPDLRGIFALEHHDDTPLDDAVFDLVLGPSPEDMRRALALMGVAIDLSEASIAPILDIEDRQTGRQIIEFLERDLWVSHRVLDGRADPPRLHPFARRAIAHRLGRPGGIAGLSWETAHALLRDGAAPEDRLTTLYHDLALGHIGNVAAGLSELFDRNDPRDWYDLLLQVTAAPLARPDGGDDAEDHHGVICAGSDVGTAVSEQLVAALQLHTDPLGDPTHKMCAVVTDEFGELSRKAGMGRAFLLAQSRDFTDCWSHWPSR